MKINHPDTAPNFFEVAGDIRTGKGLSGEHLDTKDRVSRVLLEGNEGAPDNYMLGYSASELKGGATGTDWTSPRHRHNFEQVRYVLEGDFYITKDEVLPAGWVSYFPESAYYGPQIKSANLKMIGLQFGGPSGNGYASTHQQGAGFNALLQKGGEIKDGIYQWVDESGKLHKQDSSEACWELIFGKKVVYPEPRYDRCISMNPASFAWVKDEDASGVAHKWLGTFTEREIRIGFIHLDKGAKLRFGTEPSAEIMVMSEGGISHNGTNHEGVTAFGSAATDGVEELVATAESELLYVKLPTF